MLLYTLLALNRYGHDFSSAMWVVGIFFLYVLNKEMKGKADPVLSEFMGRIYKKLNILLWISFVLIFLCGIVRSVTYYQFEWNEKMGQSQVWLLIVKHIAFFIVLLLGVSIWWKFHRQIKNVRT